MSISTAEKIVERIKKAPPHSAIAVFRLTDEERTIVKAESIETGKPARGNLNAVFAASVPTKQRIKKNDPLFVGTFDRRDSPSLVLNHLKRLEKTFLKEK